MSRGKSVLSNRRLIQGESELTKRAFCLAIHSSNSSGVNGVNLMLDFETLSMISGGTRSVRMSFQRSRAGRSVDL